MSLKDIINRDWLLICSGAITILFFAAIVMTTHLALEVMDYPSNLTMADVLIKSQEQGITPILATTFLAGIFLIIVKYMVLGAMWGINIAIFAFEVIKRLRARDEKSRKRRMATERTRRWREKQRK